MEGTSYSATWNLSVFVTYSTEGAVSSSQQEVSVGKGSQVVNVWEEEATVAGFCKH